MKILFVWPNKDSFGYKPIGLSLLAGIANNLGWDVKLFDTTEIDFGFTDNTAAGVVANIFKPVDCLTNVFKKRKIDLKSKVIEILDELKPDCLAFSVLSDEFLIAAQISKISKKERPKIPIIWGGKYPTLNPEKTLKLYNADFVCIGEGFDAFSDFLNAFSGGNNFYAIPNIWAKRNGKIIRNSIRPLRKSLDVLPYVNWDIFDKRHFYKPFDGKAYVGGDHMLNWGCPYHCTYCINHFYHQLYENNYFMRRYGVERIIKELKYLKERFRIGFFRFHDEDFLMRPVDNLKELSYAYRQEIRIPFVISTNPKSVTEKKVILLKEMNCVSASVGIETGDFKIRKKLLKRLDTAKDIIRAFYLFREAGIRTSSFNMFGIPFESRKTYQKTVNLNKKAAVQYPNMGFFYPFEGTELREVSIKEGFFDPHDKKTQVYFHDRPVLHFPDLTEKELIELRNVFVFYVKLPRCYKPFISRSEKLDKVGIKLRKYLSDIYRKTVVNNNGWYFDEGKETFYIDRLNKILVSERTNK